VIEAQKKKGENKQVRERKSKVRGKEKRRPGGEGGRKEKEKK
jgi:hypothetical protein